MAALIPKAVQEYVLHWEEMHPWQWLREMFVRPILGDQAGERISRPGTPG
jgi:hypothetical protein